MVSKNKKQPLNKNGVSDRLSKQPSYLNKRNIIIGIILLAIILAIPVSLKLYNRHKLSSDTYQAKRLFNEYDIITEEYTTLPSSVTKTQSQWDSYYGGLIKQIKSLQQTNTQNLLNSALNNFRQDYAAATNDTINYLAVVQTATDTTFKITSDNGIITDDNNTIQSDTNTANQNCILNETNPYIACNYSTVAADKQSLSTDTAQLNTDQQSEQQEANQAKELGSVVASDNEKLLQAIKAADGE